MSVGTFKKAGQGIVAHRATANLTNVKVGDLISVIGDATVGFAAGKRTVGEVVAVDPTLTVDNCTVEYFVPKLIKGIAEGGVTGGQYVKAGTAKNQFVAVTIIETSVDMLEVCGIALESALTTEEFVIIPL